MCAVANAGKQKPKASTRRRNGRNQKEPLYVTIATESDAVDATRQRPTKTLIQASGTWQTAPRSIVAENAPEEEEQKVCGYVTTDVASCKSRSATSAWQGQHMVTKLQAILAFLMFASESAWKRRHRWLSVARNRCKRKRETSDPKVIAATLQSSVAAVCVIFSKKPLRQPDGSPCGSILLVTTEAIAASVLS